MRKDNYLMKNIKLMNKIAPVGIEQFPASAYSVGENITGEDAILVRSASLHETAFDPNLKAIARAGAGVNNIPVEECAKKGIVVFNTPGANANGVKELTLCALFLSARDVVGGIDWASTLKEDVAKSVEKGKSAFAGEELLGKTLGVIGLGAIGGMVANTAYHLGMKVIGCDPYISVEGAWRLSSHVHKASAYEEIYRECDYITLHVPATPATKNMINKETLAMMKDGVRIINLSRADLVDIDAMKEALESGKVARYVTDFPTEQNIGVKNIVAIPHLGASTEESEDNCAVMAARELIDYLENGNITNSVNFPSVKLDPSSASRVTVLHLNIPNMISTISGVFSASGLNIENMANRSKGEYAVTILDIAGEITDEAIEKLSAVDGIIRAIRVK